VEREDGEGKTGVSQAARRNQNKLTYQLFSS
jgi:hypothetical protein